MTIQITESVWLNTSDTCSFDHVVEVSGLSKDELLDLVQTGAIEPSGQQRDQYFFHTHCIAIARSARRLSDDFELNPTGLALALNLMRSLDALEDARARHQPGRASGRAKVG